jgi:hypothetical protein
MDPLKISSGVAKGAEFRQVLSWSNGSEGEFRLALLGSERCGVDVVVFMDLRNETEPMELQTVKMSGRNGRLVESNDSVTWQARNGTLFSSKNFPIL